MDGRKEGEIIENNRKSMKNTPTEEEEEEEPSGLLLAVMFCTGRDRVGGGGTERESKQRAGDVRERYVVLVMQLDKRLSIEKLPKS